MSTITTTAAMSLTAVLANVPDLGTDQSRRMISASQVLTDGVAAAEANLLFSDTRTLAASATEDLDLAGALTNPLGVAQVFARIKAIFVQADAANTNNVNITRPASNGVPLFLAAGDGIGLRPGETFGLLVGAADAVGHAVTAATGDLLTFTNAAAGTPVSYSIIVIGAST